MMRKITFADVVETFTRYEAEEAIDMVAEDNSALIGELLSGPSLPADPDLAEIALAVSHFGAFCAGVLTAQRLIKECT